MPVIDVPFGIDPDDYEGLTGKEEFPSLFSLGSMNWIPNQEGIRWFLSEVWPDLHRFFPELHYYLAGREMPAWMTALSAPNVHVVGEVPDAKVFLGSKSVMIVPLFSGSGIRIKIIEGMAAGKTIVSTTIGAEGIRYSSRTNIFIADTSCEFFEAVSLCVTDKALCRRIGDEAQAFARKEFDAHRLVRKLTAFYQQLMK
jgi:glycosyltransferase involved in cell wall biosynthesis